MLRGENLIEGGRGGRTGGPLLELVRVGARADQGASLVKDRTDLLRGAFEDDVAVVLTAVDRINGPSLPMANLPKLD